MSNKVSFVTNLIVDFVGGSAYFSAESEGITEYSDLNEIKLCKFIYENTFDTTRTGSVIRCFFYRDRFWVVAADAFKFLWISSGGSRMDKVPPIDKGNMSIVGASSYLNAISKDGLKQLLLFLSNKSHQYKPFIAQNFLDTINEAEDMLRAEYCEKLHPHMICSDDKSYEAIVQKAIQESEDVHVIDDESHVTVKEDDLSSIDPNRSYSDRTDATDMNMNSDSASTEIPSVDAVDQSSTEQATAIYPADSLKPAQPSLEDSIFAITNDIAEIRCQLKQILDKLEARLV